MNDVQFSLPVSQNVVECCTMSGQSNIDARDYTYTLDSPATFPTCQQIEKYCRDLRVQQKIRVSCKVAPMPGHAPLNYGSVELYNQFGWQTPDNKYEVRISGDRDTIANEADKISAELQRLLGS